MTQENKGSERTAKHRKIAAKRQMQGSGAQHSLVECCAPITRQMPLCSQIFAALFSYGTAPKGGIHLGRGYLARIGREPCGGARFPGRCEHRPLQGFDVTQGLRFPGWPRARRWLQGRIPYPPAGVRGGAGCGGMRASRPTAVRMGGAVPVGSKHKICP